MLTQSQLDALKYLILVSKDGEVLAKKILLHLIAHSERLTKEVCLTVIEGREGFTSEEIEKAAYGVHDMQSSNGTTHLSEVMVAMGASMLFNLHSGDFDPDRQGDPFNHEFEKDRRKRYTFWLDRTFYSREATYIPTSKVDLQKVDVRKPNLDYPCNLSIPA